MIVDTIMNELYDNEPHFKYGGSDYCEPEVILKNGEVLLLFTTRGTTSLFFLLSAQVVKLIGITIPFVKIVLKSLF